MQEHRRWCIFKTRISKYCLIAYRSTRSHLNFARLIYESFRRVTFRIPVGKMVTEYSNDIFVSMAVKISPANSFQFRMFWYFSRDTHPQGYEGWGGVLMTRPLPLLASSAGCTNGTTTRVSRKLIARSCQNLVPFQIWQSDLKGRGRKGTSKEQGTTQGGPC